MPLPYRRWVLVLVAFFTLSGCSLVRPRNAPPSVGLYRTQNSGRDWIALHRLLLPGGVGALTGLSINEFFGDPSDFRALYLAAPGIGLLYTFDAGQTWQQARDIAGGTVNDVSVDPKDTCTIYVAVGDRALKSVDCNRSFREVHIDPRPNAVMTVTVDREKSNVVYLGTSSGELLRSLDGGGSWSRLHQFPSGVKWIVPDPNNAKRVFALTTNNGLFRSTDGFVTWQSLSNGLIPFSQGQEITSLQVVNDQPNTVMLLNRYGLLKSTNGGDTWTALNLVTQPLAARISAFAVNPSNSREVHYATGSTFYTSADGGVNWVTRRLPGRQAVPLVLYIHPRDRASLYLGLGVARTR